MLDGIAHNAHDGMLVAQQRLNASAQRVATMVPQTSAATENLALDPGAGSDTAPSSYIAPLQGPPVALLREQVNLVSEAVNQIEAVNAFRANATMLRETAELSETTLEIGADE
jgi:hypothetical protein